MRQRLGIATALIGDVAHEALLRQWPPLREAIEASRASLRMRTELERLATDWDRGRRDESYLLRGGRLAAFDRWATEHSGEITLLERQFVQASRALASRELDAARRSNRRLRVLVAGLAILLVLTVGAGALAVQNNRQAQSQARLALSGKLSVQADSLVQTRLDTAILVGLESLSVARGDTPKPQPPAGLITGLARANHASKPINGHTDQVQGVAFSPDGKLLATASWDKTVRLWDVASGKQHGQPLTGHQDAVLDVGFSPDGRLLASAGLDGTVRLWDVASGKQHGQPLTGHSQPVNALAFSPDGKLLATASWDKTARLWQVSSGRPASQPLVGHRDELRGVAFSPDGKLLATSGLDDTARLWEVASGKQHGQPLTRHRDDVWALAFSPDGKLLATASADQTARLWDVASGKQRGQPLLGHTNIVLDVAFTHRRSRCSGPARTASNWRPRAGTGRHGCGTWPRPIRSVGPSPVTRTR